MKPHEDIYTEQKARRRWLNYLAEAIIILVSLFDLYFLFLWTGQIMDTPWFPLVFTFGGLVVLEWYHFWQKKRERWL